MTDTVFRMRDQIETDVVEPTGDELVRVWTNAGVALVPLLTELANVVDLDAEGRMPPGAQNVDAVASHMATFKEASDGLIRAAGRLWAGMAIERAFRAGQRLGWANLEVDALRPEIAVQARNTGVTTAQAGIIKAGMDDTIGAVNLVGDRVDDHVSRKVLQAMFEGWPVVDKSGGHSLMRELIEDGQLKPIEVTTKAGTVVKRSLAQQAEAIARIEMAKVMERTHNELAQNALGEQMVAINSNPNDSRTTSICRRASNAGALSRQQWLASGLGLAPRLNPFHFCRSTMVWGLPEWFT